MAQGPQERDPATRKDGHKRRQDPSVTVRFQLEDEEASLVGLDHDAVDLCPAISLSRFIPDVEYVKVPGRGLRGRSPMPSLGRLADYQARERSRSHRGIGAGLAARIWWGDTMRSRCCPYFADQAEDKRRSAVRPFVSSRPIM